MCDTMTRKIIAAFTAVALTLVLARPAAAQNELAGALLGGVGGALAGGALVGGKNGVIGQGHKSQMVGVAAGALLGAGIGQSMGRSMDQTDAAWQRGSGGGYGGGYAPSSRSTVVLPQGQTTYVYPADNSSRHHNRHHHHHQQTTTYVYAPPPPPTVIYQTAPVRETVVVTRPAYPQQVPAYIPASRPSSGDYCREYQGNIMVGGRPVPGYGTTCMRPDGSWELGPLQPER
ncbi:MAG: hypothetical protein K2Q10_13965 [Rhodospirillales bacterium]|nr:hypothetical protein [Rhodospirillales bacterium]